MNSSDDPTTAEKGPAPGAPLRSVFDVAMFIAGDPELRAIVTRWTGDGQVTQPAATPSETDAGIFAKIPDLLQDDGVRAALQQWFAGSPGQPKPPGQT